MYDVIIVGAGAAGLTAAIYTCRKALKTAVISKDIGGQTMLSSHMENYPGFKGAGFQLMLDFKEQAESFGAEIIQEEVVDIKKLDKGFVATTGSGKSYKSQVLILAFGKVPRNLGLPGEEELLGKGVHVCATCDGPMYKDKDVLIIGGGNSALEAATYIASIANKVYLMHRRDEFRGDEALVEKVRSNKKIELLLSHLPVEFKGDKFLSTVLIENLKDKSKKELKVDGVFIEIGYHVRAAIVKHLVELNENKEIVVDDQTRTSCEGIFAAGDVTTTPYKQTVIAAGDGAKAGLSAYAYLKGLDVVDVDKS